MPSRYQITLLHPISLSYWSRSDIFWLLEHFSHRICENILLAFMFSICKMDLQGIIYIKIVEQLFVAWENVFFCQMYIFMDTQTWICLKVPVTNLNLWISTEAVFSCIQHIDVFSLRLLIAFFPLRLLIAFFPLRLLIAFFPPRLLIAFFSSSYLT